MPDISMCKRENCSSKENCYRFTTLANVHWQSYTVDELPDNPIEQCSMFWGNKEEKIDE